MESTSFAARMATLTQTLLFIAELLRLDPARPHPRAMRDLLRKTEALLHMANIRAGQNSATYAPVIETLETLLHRTTKDYMAMTKVNQMPDATATRHSLLDLNKRLSVHIDIDGRIDRSHFTCNLASLSHSIHQTHTPLSHVVKHRKEYPPSSQFAEPHSPPSTSTSESTSTAHPTAAHRSPHQTSRAETWETHTTFRTDSTASNLPGPGLTMDRFLSTAGRGVDRLIGRLQQ